MEDEKKEGLDASQGEDATAQPARGSSPARGELSAQALGRMIGLVTMGDIQILESKVDLLSSKVNQLTVKMEKLFGVVTKAPTGADLERIDIQIGSLKAAILDFIGKNTTVGTETKQAEGGGNAAKPGDKKRVTLSSMND